MHDGLRTEVRGPGYDRIILAQLWYEHETMLDKARGDFLSQVVASLDKSQASTLFCLHHLFLRVVRRAGEPFASAALASTPFVLVVSVRFRGDVTD